MELELIFDRIMAFLVRFFALYGIINHFTVFEGIFSKIVNMLEA